MARIAIVDDDRQFADFVRQTLQLQGWTAVTITHTREAYGALKRQLPDLIILDVRMDTVDKGWQILCGLMLDSTMRNIPVLICSAAIDEINERQGWLDEHHVGFLPKPFNIDDLYAEVKGALAHSLSAPAGTQRAQMSRSR